MSRFLCLGMSLGDVIASSTVNAATALKRPLCLAVLLGSDLDRANTK
jgi:predicted amidohydrolase